MSTFHLIPLASVADIRFYPQRITHYSVSSLISSRVLKDITIDQQTDLSCKVDGSLSSVAIRYRYSACGTPTPWRPSVEAVFWNQRARRSSVSYYGGQVISATGLYFSLAVGLSAVMQGYMQVTECHIQTMCLRSMAMGGS
jgi:hypothetical protein